jgi:hypothetical protein
MARTSTPLSQTKTLSTSTQPNPYIQDTEGRPATARSQQAINHLTCKRIHQASLHYVSLAILPQPLSAHAFVNRRRPRSVRGFRSHGFGQDRAISGLDCDGGRSQAVAAGAYGGPKGEVRGGLCSRPKEGICGSHCVSSVLPAVAFRRVLEA